MQAVIAANSRHCRHCFDVLLSKLTKSPLPEWPAALPNHVSPLFVTWTYTKDHELRGCIGTFQAAPLVTSLPNFVLTSALKDPRFPPISLEEVEEMTAQVSLLINFQGPKQAMDWQLGKHGILIEFVHNGREYDGTFLPEVAVEQEWSKEETLKELVWKAGYKGPIGSIIEKIKLTTYESSKAALSYQQYVQMINQQK